MRAKRRQDPRGLGVQMEGKAPKGCAGSSKGRPGGVEGVLKEKPQRCGDALRGVLTNGGAQKGRL